MQGGRVWEAAMKSAGRGGFWLPYTEANKARATRGSPAQRRAAGFPTPPGPAGAFNHRRLFFSSGRFLGSRWEGCPPLGTSLGSTGQACWRTVSGDRGASAPLSS